MKKNIITILLSVVLLSSCTLDREPLTGPSTGTFPASAEEAEAGLLAAYKSLANDIHQYNPGDRWYDQLSDIGAMRTTLSSWPNFGLSTVTSNLSHVENTYARIYKAIGRVHLVLDNLDNLRGVVTDEQYYQFKAELLCLRAYQYDKGCKIYGDMPWVDHALTLDDYSYARTSKAEVIANILRDLDDELINHLPIAWDKATWGTCRIGRVGAYMLKARICLEWGFYADAAKYSKIALDLAAGVYDLTPLDCTYYATHADGEPNPTPLFGYDAEKNSAEWIWAIQFDRLAASNTHQGIYSHGSRVHNGSAAVGPSQSFIDTFQCVDGLSIAESPKYDWKNPWKDRDPRLDLFCLRSGARAMGVQFSTDPADKTVFDYNIGKAVPNGDVTGNKSEYGPNGTKGPGGYLWRKYLNMEYYASVPGKDYEDELDVPIMRLAELLLIDAEANIEMEGGDLTRAKANIDRIRARVGMPPVTATDQAGLRTALRYERKVELCCEGFRWFDIRRWKGADGNPLAYKAMNGPQYAPAFGASSTGDTAFNLVPQIDENWIVTYDPAKTFKDAKANYRVHTTLTFKLNKDELWPFPYSEMITNPLIGEANNNPGY